MNDFSKLVAQTEIGFLAKVDPRELGDDTSEYDGEIQDDEPHGSHDMSDDADALASAGYGTDEDYGGSSYHLGDDY